MPEYSSTTITPADAVQTPAMNGGTSGNYTLSSLKGYVLAGKGQANGIASLDANGKLPSSQLPEIADDVLVYDSYATLPVTGLEGVIYITADTERMYRWDGAQYAELSVDLSAYATKAYVDEADGVLEAKVSQHEARIANLEQVSGDYVPSDMQDGDTVPTGKASFALVETMKGVSRVENQLVDKTALSTATINGITFTNNGDGSWTISGTATAETYVILVSSSRISANHKYLFGIIGSTNVYLWQYGYDANKTNSYSIQNNNSDNPFGFLISNGTVFSTPETVTPFITDLTTYFNGNIPSNADTVAHIAQYYPELLEPRSYNAGEIKNSTYTKVKSVGVNIWDEHWKMGHLVAGQEVSDSTYRLISSDFSECMGGVTYYFNCGVNSGCTFYVFDKDKNYLGYDLDSSNHSSFTTRANARYFKIQLYSEYASSASAVYGNNIQFCLNSLPDAVKTTYHPYMTDQLAIPSVTLKGAGSVHEVYDLETGEVTHPIGEIDLGLQNWVYSTTSNNVYLFTCVPTKPAKNVPTSTDILNAFCASNKVKISAQYYWNTEPYLVSGYNDGAGRLLCTFTSNDVNALKTYLSGVMFDYELATPDPSTYVTPTLNNTLKTEGGGTVFTDADVDGRFTLGFLNL